MLLCRNRMGPPTAKINIPVMTVVSELMVCVTDVFAFSLFSFPHECTLLYDPEASYQYVIAHIVPL